ELGGTGVYFRLGRTTRASRSLYDRHTNNFVDEELENAPYTHVVIELELGLCGIARRYQLAQETGGIARQLEKLLNRSEISSESGARIEIAEIPDPNEFLEQLRSAWAITSFALTFS